jgi:hypothetical protein
MVLYRMLPWLRIGFGLLAVVAIARQLVVQIQLSFSVVNFFSYFTNLANAYAAGVLILGGCHSITGREVLRVGEPARVASVAYMAVVGIVFGLLLRTVDLGSLRPWVNDVLHIVTPCVVVIDWLAAPPPQEARFPYSGAIAHFSGGIPGVCADSRQPGGMVSVPLPRSRPAGRLPKRHWPCRGYCRHICVRRVDDDYRGQQIDEPALEMMGS